MDLMWISGYESELDARPSLDMAYSASPPTGAGDSGADHAAGDSWVAGSGVNGYRNGSWWLIVVNNG